MMLSDGRTPFPRLVLKIAPGISATGIHPLQHQRIKDVYPFKNDEAVEVTDEGKIFIGSTNCQKHRSGSGKTIKK